MTKQKSYKSFIKYFSKVLYKVQIYQSLNLVNFKLTRASSNIQISKFIQAKFIKSTINFSAAPQDIKEKSILIKNQTSIKTTVK